MKKILLCLTFSLLGIVGFAQAGHLKFLEFEMGGPLKEFYQNVISKGFSTDYPPRVLWKANSDAQVRGRFAGQEDARIQICAKNNMVDMVIVAFPAKETWEDAKLNYLTLWDAFSKKYSVDKSKEAGNLDVEGEKCTSRFDVIDGVILLSLEDKNGGYAVSITYADRPGNGHSTGRDSSVMGDI